MDTQRLKQIKREARRAEGAGLHALFMEVYGADFAGAVSEARARMSILEAVEELMQKPSRNAGQEKIMEELIKQLIAEAKQTNVLLTQLVNGKKRPSTELYVDGKGKPADPVPGAEPKTPEVVDATEPEKKKGKKEEKPKITIEQLRETANRYVAAFGMEELLAANQKFGGAKKISAIPAENYGTLHAELEARLAREDGKKATTPPADEKPAELTAEAVKAKAKEFMDKNGAPALTALLKAFGAEKLSLLDKSKYGAFVEAISNS